MLVPAQAGIKCLCPPSLSPRRNIRAPKRLLSRLGNPVTPAKTGSANPGCVRWAFVLRLVLRSCKRRRKPRAKGGAASNNLFDREKLCRVGLWPTPYLKHFRRKLLQPLADSIFGMPHLHKQPGVVFYRFLQMRVLMPRLPGELYENH